METPITNKQTTDKAILAVLDLCHAATWAWNRSTKAAMKREAKAIAVVLEMILGRKPTPDEIKQATAK